MLEIFTTLALLGVPQDHPGVDSAKVGAAIHKGLTFLKQSGSPAAYPADVAWHVPDSDELILLTFVHTDVSPRDPKFKEYFDKMMKARLDRTYKVVLQTMVLEEFNRRIYQRRIMYCGTWLVNNQCENGQWGYGEPIPELEGVPTQSYRNPVASITRPGRDGKLKKPSVSKRLRVRQVRFAGASGDNSNSQYAALGLRACEDAGVIVPKETIARARMWWEKTGIVDGDKNAVATGGSGIPTGWGYRINQTGDPYASRTAGAVGAVVIYDHLLGKKWKRDKTALGGMAWLAKHFSVTKNGPGRPHFGGQPDSMLYYYLYALERAGILSGTVDIGTHDWYREGANFILKSQKEDGSWKTATGGGNAVWDTCFAILFLKRATRPLVASIDE